MRRTIAAALALLALSVPSLAAAQAPDAPRRQIVVAGSGRVEAAPDLAAITAGVETQAATAAEALAAGSGVMAGVLDALRGLGVEARDMQTSQLNLEPVWDQEQAETGAAPAVVAYRASNLVTLRLRAVDRIGAAVDAMTKAGANRLYGISFEIAEPGPALDAARERAVADARARAELYARAAGVRLGLVLEIRESADRPGPILMRAEAMSDVAPPAEGGSVPVTADVEIVFALE